MSHKQAYRRHLNIFLVTFAADMWDVAACLLCVRNMPINITVGKGREFLAHQTRAKAKNRRGAEILCIYAPRLRSSNSNRVMLARGVEVQHGDGSWHPYPGVTWLDGAANNEQLQTLAIIKRTECDGLDIMGSSDGVPDGILMSAAKRAEIHTETIG